MHPLNRELKNLNIALPLDVNLRVKPLINLTFTLLPDPPKSPLKRGTKEKTPVPPLKKGDEREDSSLLT